MSAYSYFNVDTTTGLDTVPTVTDNAFTQGLLASKEVGISFAPATSESDPNGQLTFGGIDPTKFTGDITFVYVLLLFVELTRSSRHDSPITSTSPSSEFVGIDQSITFGSAGTSILAPTAGIVDTGTTLTLIASGKLIFVFFENEMTHTAGLPDAFATYQQLTGGVTDEATGLLSITPAQFASLQSLFFNIGGVSSHSETTACIHSLVYIRRLRSNLLPTLRFGLVR